MLHQQLKFFDFISKLDDKAFIFDLLIDSEILSFETIKSCSYCYTGISRIVFDKNDKIGRIFKCGSKKCRKKESLLKSTYFQNKCIRKTLTVIAGFVRGKKIQDLLRDFELDEKFVMKIYGEIRNKINDYMENYNIYLGGENVIVEIDETHLFTRKYNRGNVLASQQIWLFGVFERISKRCIIRVVERRDATTLVNIVNQLLYPGTIIMADSWRGYSKIKEIFITKQVNHKYYFVDPQNREIHTNNIERLWRSLKNDIIGVCNGNYSKAINAFCYKRNFFTDDLYSNVVKLLQLFK